jgi:hypothetical protein
LLLPVKATLEIVIDGEALADLLATVEAAIAARSVADVPLASAQNRLESEAA